MERLTYKNYIEEYEVNFEKNSEKQWSIAESDTHIKVTGEPIDKLGQLEDVLEKYGIESVEELEDYLSPKLFCYAKLSENLDELEKYYQSEPFIHIDTCEPQIELITDKVKDLKHQLAVKDRALELACIECAFFDYSKTENGKAKQKRFIKQAEKELKGE